METSKNKLVKSAKICAMIAKVLYLLSCVACLVLIVLTIVLPLTNAVGTETAVILGTLALYAFICIGLLWNIEGIFVTISKEGTPFTEKVSHYLKKVAVFAIVLSIIPAVLGTAIIKLACPETEQTFPIEVGGVLVGAVIFMIGHFFDYGKELQKQDDETL